MSKVLNLEEKFPILAIEDNTVISKMADITLCFKLEMPEIFSLNETDYDYLSTLWERALGVLPINTVLHKQDWYIEERYLPNYDAEYLLKAKIVAHANERHFANRPFLSSKSYLFITKSTSTVEKKICTSSNLFKAEAVPKTQLNEKDKKEFVEAVGQFIMILKESGFYKVDEINGEQISKIYDNYSSLSFKENSISDIEPKQFKIGGNHCKTLTINQLEDFPSVIANQTKLEKYCTDKTYIGISLGANLGIMLPFSHIYNQIIVIIDHNDLLQKLNQDIKRFTSLSAYSKENLVNRDYKEEFVEVSLADNEKAVAVHANILIWDNDINVLEDNRSMVSAAITKMGFKPKQAEYDGFLLYWYCIPGNAADIGKDNLSIVFRSHAICLLALEANYKDALLNEFQGNPQGMVVTDRLTGIPLMLDVFDEPMKKGLVTNRNVMIVGPSGSGKSFLTNNLMYYLYERGSHITIVDTGNSYKRLCELVGGRYITYDEKKPIAFNPFHIQSILPDLETKENLVTILEALWKGEDSSVSTSENTTLDDMIVRFYETLVELKQKGKHFFVDFNLFFDYCNEVYPTIFNKNDGREKEFDLKNFLYIMRRYYKNGQYGYLLNSRENFEIEKHPFVVFELDNIKDHPVLFPITSIIIMNAYAQKLVKMKGFYKFLVIEEAWKAVSNPAFAQFMKWVSKTARKHGGGLITVTQEYQDLTSELVKDAIINNSPTKVLLDFSRYKNYIQEVANTLGLSGAETDMLLSVNQANDPIRKYKEFFITFGGNLSKVFGLEVSPEAYATFTTERKESDLIYALSEKIGLENAIKTFARE